MPAKRALRLVFAPLAVRDLEAIGDYIARDSPKRALSFIAELRTVCATIAAEPEAFRLRPELGEGIRSCAHGNFMIFFLPSRQQVKIVRVLHGSMDLPAQIAAPPREPSK